MQHTHQHHDHDPYMPYKKLGCIALLNGLIMFLLTYALVATVDHIYFNLNRVYMSIMMVCPMMIVMMRSMQSMYTDKKLNFILYLAFAVIFTGVFFLARAQIPIGNTQFLRSMISHHSSAIVMCEKADISNTEILHLCDSIIDTQKREIDQMQKILQNP